MDVAEKPGYSAPALEKGLDILELLSASDQPLTVRAIAEQLGCTRRAVTTKIDRLRKRLEKLLKDDTPGGLER